MQYNETDRHNHHFGVGRRSLFCDPTDVARTQDGWLRMRMRGMHPSLCIRAKGQDAALNGLRYQSVQKERAKGMDKSLSCLEHGTALDLHMHTNISDGTDTPAEILDHVRQKGLKLFSITDHDAMKAAGIVRKLLKEGDPLYLPGVEFSCKDEGGQYHILGYGFDLESPEILGVVNLGHGLRMEKVTARLDFLRDRFGFIFPEEELKRLLSMDNPGKPHIGNLMVKYGYAKSKEEAIHSYIDKLRVGNKYVRPEQAIQGILGAGGIPVLAHPSYGNGDQMILGSDLEERVIRLMRMGLQGLEAFYSGFTLKLNAENLMLAERYGLYITAGSDYHGANKLIELGDIGVPEIPDPPEGLRRFLKDALSKIPAVPADPAPQAVPPTPGTESLPEEETTGERP
jgi:predicted metal-dependent phosphoesterase TrpH